MQRNSKDKDSDTVCIGKFSEGRAVFSDGRRGKSGGGGGRFGFWRTVRHPDAPGILALVNWSHYTMEEVVQAETPHLMILEHLQDPGNLGTIFRAGEGAGVTGIVMDSQTVDVYSPKVIRATMGSVLRIPFVYVENLKESLFFLKNRGVQLFAACLEESQEYDQENYQGSVGFLIGNEANGLTPETAAAADVRIHIPMEGKVESLNAAMAATVLMYEAARQRRRKR